MYISKHDCKLTSALHRTLWTRQNITGCCVCCLCNVYHTVQCLKRNLRSSVNVQSTKTEVDQKGDETALQGDRDTILEGSLWRELHFPVGHWCNATTSCKSTLDTVPYFGLNGLSMILCLWPPLHLFSKLLAIQDHAQNLKEQLWMGGGGGSVFYLTDLWLAAIWSKTGCFFVRVSQHFCYWLSESFIPL